MMYKLVKWSYRRGVMAERNRVKRLIAEHRQEKPDMIKADDKFRGNQFELAVWQEVTYELGKLTSPYLGSIQENVSPIDEDC